MTNLKTRFLLSAFTIMFLLSVPYAGAQDTSLIGIQKGNIWVYELIENTMTDENGTIIDFTISSDEDGVVNVGETYELEITGDPSSTGSYGFSYNNGWTEAVGTGNLGQFGSDAIYTDWDYWSTTAEDDTIFDLMDVTITDDAEDFSVKGEMNLEGLVPINSTIEIVYFKTTGVIKSLSLINIYDTTEEALIVENITGSIATEVPGFGFLITLLALVAVPVISKKRT